MSELHLEDQDGWEADVLDTLRQAPGVISVEGRDFVRDGKFRTIILSFETEEEAALFTKHAAASLNDVRQSANRA